MKRVVADTNILVSALQFGGKPKQLLDLAADGQIDLAISEAIIAETLRVLGDKFNGTPDWLTEAERQLRVIARLVEPTESLQVVLTPATTGFWNVPLWPAPRRSSAAMHIFSASAAFGEYGSNASRSTLAAFRNCVQADLLADPRRQDQARDSRPGPGQRTGVDRAGLVGVGPRHRLDHFRDGRRRLATPGLVVRHGPCLAWSAASDLSGRDMIRGST